MKKTIQDLAEKFYDETVKIRRHIHKYPELSFNEYNTSEFIKSELDRLNVSYTDGWAETGILAKIEGKYKGKTIALRADIDALPINEQTGLDYQSQNKGVMHACGHDVHTASLLTTIKILNQIKNKLKGTILFLFQPGEEQLPGGAKLMLEEGIFFNNKPDLIIAQHVLPEMETGKAGFKSGMYMASTDEIYITIKGKGGHAALPHKIDDVVLAASQTIVNLQQIVSRKAPANIPSVLSFGKFIANGATNVIPNEVKIEGTFRTMNEKWRKQVHKLIKQICENTAASHFVSAEVEIKNGYPFLKNDEYLTKKTKEIAKKYLGNNNVEDMDIRMTGEDFAYFSQEYPVCYYRIGVKQPESKKIYSLHSSNFQVDEKSLKFASGLMAYIAYSLLTDD